ncbi:MAG: Fe-S cluster protein [Gammaproteobacteria bacterium]|nr:MAG: Fe-S cluster protein [Gammaproteobacteria bacterium]
MTILGAAAILAGLAAALASLLLLADRRLRVTEDGRIVAVTEALPGINCGSCGYPSCRAFAEALVAGATSPASCSVSPPEMRERIATFLGVDIGEANRRVARLACAGGRNVAPFLARYQSEPTCAAATQVAGGGKACAWGCLGHGDCERACDFDAIWMDAHGLPVVDEALCTACGDCVRACPKDLFRLVSESDPLWVACSNPETGNELLEVCQVACTACGKCAKDAPAWLQMEDGLPRRTEKAVGAPPRAAIDRCPTGAIVWIEEGRTHLGMEARRPRRQEDLPVVAD